MMVSIQLCMGSSCHSRGNARAREIIAGFLKRNKLEDRVEFRGMLCMGECGQGPNVIINGKIYNRAEEGVLLDILSEVFNGDLIDER